MSRQFSSSPIYLILACNLLLNFSSATSPRHRGSRSTLASLSSKPSYSERLSVLGACRCVPDQWEAVMRSVEREVDLQAAVMSLFTPSGTEDTGDLRSASPSHSSEELQIGEDVDMNEMIGLSQSEEPQRNGQDYLARSAMDFTASEESTTSIYYDYTARRLAVVEQNPVGSGIHRRTITDHKAGVRYVISSDGDCRTSAIRQIMKRMCLPAGVTLSGKFNLGADVQVSLWTATGPNNSTLRTAVDRRRCIPVYEETFTLEPDYLSLKTTFYTNVRLGIKDVTVFAIPPTCHPEITETGQTSDTKRRP